MENWAGSNVVALLVAFSTDPANAPLGNSGEPYCSGFRINQLTGPDIVAKSTALTTNPRTAS